MNINNFDQLFRQIISGSGDTGATVRLELSRVDPKILRNLTHVTVENQNNSYIKCRLGISSGAIVFYLDELTTIAAAELAVSRSDILLGDGDVFFAELKGTTDGDSLVMSCIGWELAL